MPGVPTYRGCDACHKQKKKCDKASPACSRCARLKIPCVGTGQLRYKFKEQFNPVKPAAKTQLARRQAAFRSYTLPLSPENEIDSLVKRFTLALKVTEPRFDVNSLGTWFVDVPARLGTSTLLDSSAAAFVAAIEDLRSGKPTVTALAQYGKALNCLRTTLKDPVDAKAPYTLASIFMLMVSQSWVSNSSDYIDHMEGVTYLLNCSAGDKWHGEFEETLRFHLAIPAFVESAINPKLQLDPWYASKYSTPIGPYKSLDQEEGQPIETVDIPQIMRFPALLRDPEQKRAELRKEYDRMLIEVPFLRRRLNTISEANRAASAPRLEIIRAEIQVRLAYAVLLCYALAVNGFLSAMDPLDILLQDEAIQFAKEAIWVAQVSRQDLPIGAGFMPATIFAAWTATDDSGVLEGIKAAMVDYKLHWAEWHYVERFREMKHRMRRIRDKKLAELRAAGHVGLDVTDFTSADGFSYDWSVNWEDTSPA